MKKVKILHIFPYGIFVSKYINGFCQYRDSRYEHCFFLYGDVDMQRDRKIQIPNIDNVIYANPKCEGIEEHIECADIIVVVAIPEVYDIICKINNLKKNRKLVLVPFGRDLFRTSDLYRKKDKDLVKRIDEQKRLLIKNSNVVITGDFGKKYIKDFYKCDKKTIWFDSLDLLEKCEKVENIMISDRCNILLGHRGTFTSGHIEVLKSLKKYDNSFDNIICPLSYGNEEYIKEVKKLGNELYGKRFVTIDQWMPKKEYFDFLDKNVDLVIFNNNTSEGFNTLLFLCQKGKKVYVNPLNESYSLLIKIGFPIFEWMQNEIDFSQIRNPLNERQLEKVQKAIINMNENYSFKKWFDVFESL